MPPSSTTARAGLGAALCALLAGCGRQALITTDALPVHRVVVYRNGVAYFERAGHVQGTEVRFKMKGSEVGDFLATLAVMERGGSSVRAAAFPLQVGDDNQETHSPGQSSADDGNRLETVVLSLDGKEHDLQVGYVAESPVWKPSYRLVVHSEGDADLQAWGIVENLSGEDWKDVKLSLIAAAPLAFRAQLGTPVIPSRPNVTDEGEVIAAVPRGETSLRQEPPGTAPQPLPENKAPPSPSDGPAAVAVDRRLGSPKKSAVAPTRAAPSAPPAPTAPPFPGAIDGNGMVSASAVAVSPPRSLRSLAAIAVEGGATRYDLPLPVTIPDRSATMVMLLSRHVPGGALYLFAPDSGVPDSASHPFRVARFTNGADGALERGPIAVFEGGAFLGQGIVDPLPPGATATVPFALERGLAVDQERKLDEQGERVAKIENGELTVERDRVMQTKYRVRNGGDQLAKLLVKHPRTPGSRLFAPAAGTEDNVGSGSALVPTQVSAHATSELVVDERTVIRRPTDWFDPVADGAVKSYIADPRADRVMAQKLATAWVIRGEIVTKGEERNKVRLEESHLSQAAEETRRNLVAIEKNKTAEPLRRKLTGRLAETSAQLDELNRKLVELDAKLAESKVQFQDAVRDVKITSLPPPA
ncbi:MAG: DUF4139 domain-containing protein [Myxococcota bacterium]|nr:DUF4139 domain-containing protein [Myxococcota bacterium]